MWTSRVGHGNDSAFVIDLVTKSLSNGEVIADALHYHLAVTAFTPASSSSTLNFTGRNCSISAMLVRV